MQPAFINKGGGVVHLYLCSISPKEEHQVSSSPVPICRTCEKNNELILDSKYVGRAPKAMIRLLYDQQVDTWNQVRKYYPDYSPNLTNIDLSGRILVGVNLNACNLIGANLRDIELYEAKVEWAILDYTDLSKATLVNSSFNNASIDEANLAGINARCVYFKETTFKNTNLTQAKLFRCTLSMASFKDADLTQADLRGSTMLNVTLCNAKFDQTKVSFGPVGSGTYAVVNMDIVTAQKPQLHRG